MRPTVFQKAEIRDENDVIVQQGTYGKGSALSNSTNDGWVDYVMNNLEALRSMSVGAIIPVETLPESGETGKAYVVTTGTDAGKLFMWDGEDWVEITGSLGDYLPITGGTITGNLTVEGISTAVTPNADDNSTKVATTEYVQNNVKPIETDVDIADKRISNIEKLLQGNLYDYQTDSDSAYIKSVPAGAMPYAGLEKIGGKTVAWNQLVQNGNFADGTNGWGKSATNMAISATDGTLLATIVSSVSNTVTVNTDVNIIAGHKYLIKGNISRKHTGTSNTWNSFLVRFDNATVATISTPSADIGVVKTIDQIVTATDDADKLYLGYGYVPSASVSDVFTLNNIVLFDLTQMFGSGSEPSTAEEFDEIFPVAYYVYSTPVLMSAGVTSVVSKDSSDNTLQTYSIPASVQALTGYGLSCPSHYNYIDFEAKKYVQEVGSRAYTSGDESDSTVITDGTNTYYSLNPAIETDISEYLTDDNLIQVEAGGTLTFTNSNGTDYQIPVPSEETYMIDLQSAIGG